MKSLLIPVLLISVSVSVNVLASGLSDTTSRSLNTLTANEKAKGWKLLFNGKDLAGWRSAGKTTQPQKGWHVTDGVLVVEPDKGKEAANGGDIVTLATYNNFNLVFDFKIVPGSNSGVKYFVTESYATSGSAIGLEYQILDDERHPDAKLGRDGNRTAASLYDLIPARKDKPIHPVGEWNQGRVLVRGHHVEHWLNGQKVLEYERGSAKFRTLVAGSKYKTYPGFGEAAAGHILLQDHGDQVFFKNVKIRVL